VIGLGYVGLPLVVEASRAGHRVVGLDTSPAIVAGLNAGTSHVDDISDDAVASLVAEGFRATTDESCLADADVAVICVPTPLDEQLAPDLRAVEAATGAIARHLHAGMLVVLESTTYPGTTDGLVRTRLEETGLTAGVDFELAFSPERIDPGNRQWGLRNTPKIVGGLCPSSTKRAVAFYEGVVDEVVAVEGTREAELAKLLENTYRHVNIALVNEMSIFCHELGIDLWTAIDAAKTKPFGFAAFYPGPGVGGHCIPIDPNYLSHRVRSLGYQFRFVELAQEVSGRMPVYVARRVQDALNDHGKAVRGSQVLLLGLTYKRDIADARETPAIGVIRALRRLGADIVAHDPYLTDFQVDGAPVALIDDLDAGLGRADVTVVLQPHSVYELDVVAERSQLVFDTSGTMRHPDVVRL
jgi:nucleotide sugar dehydrogenase